MKIAKEIGDRAGEGGAYGNLGNAYQSLGDYGKAQNEELITTLEMYTLY